MVLTRLRRATARATILFALAAGLTACASSSEEYVERPAADLFAEAEAHMKDEKYGKARRAFEEVDRQHPYSHLAVRAQLMAAEAAFAASEWDEAVAAAERFVQLHPAHAEAARAYEIRADALFVQFRTSANDLSRTREAIVAYGEILNRFPEGDLAAKARARVAEGRERMAAKEMIVGRHYLEEKAWLAALERFKTVASTYADTTQLPEALYRLSAAYAQIGLAPEARSIAALLARHAPDDEWTRKALALTGADRTALAGTI